MKKAAATPPDVVDLACELVSTASVNPRLAAAGHPHSGEARMTRRLADFCNAAGWPWAVQRVHPGRDNFLARVPGGAGPLVLWEAHQDTVGVEGMTVSPFAAEVRDGRLYGRGACDVKGPMAAMLVGLRRAAELPAGGRPAILFAATVNEECGFTGARQLASLWQADDFDPAQIAPDGGLTVEELRAKRPAAALVAEPTELNAVVSHRGVVRWRSVVHGRAAHSSRPEQGLNAIYAMAEVVRLIEAFHREQLASRPADPLCGRPTACVNTIAGGVGANTVPDRAVIDVDRRLAPTESPDEAYRELCERLAAEARLNGCTLEHEPPWMQSRGLSTDANLPWAERLAAVVRSAGAECRLMGVPYGTNAASIAAAGIPAVVLGPGSINQAHTADEWIAVDELQAGAEAYFRLACEGFAP